MNRPIRTAEARYVNMSVK